eukprot:g39836.t1
MLGKLKGLMVDKPPGPDGLHPRILKELAEEIVEALVGIFQKSLESMSISENWKMDNVTPLIVKKMLEEITSGMGGVFNYGGCLSKASSIGGVNGWKVDLHNGQYLNDWS